MTLLCYTYYFFHLLHLLTILEIIHVVLPIYNGTNNGKTEFFLVVPLHHHYGTTKDYGTTKYNGTTAKLQAIC